MSSRRGTASCIACCFGFVSDGAGKGFNGSARRRPGGCNVETGVGELWDMSASLI